MVLGLVVLSTFAAVIASQAVITGVFSLTRQAIQLGYLPRMEVRHTSETAIGQIYIPRVNWLLMAAVVAIVVGFGSSGKLAGAYGLAVTGAMLVDAALATVVAVLIWRWSWPLAFGAFGFLAIPDLAFFIANALKIPDGGWLPLGVAAFIFFTITTWRLGRALVARRAERRLAAAEAVPRAHGARARPRRRHGGVPDLERRLDAARLPAQSQAQQDPARADHHPAKSTRWKCRACPKPIASRSSASARASMPCIARYGFMEQPDVPAALARLPAARHRLRRDGDELLPRPRDAGARQRARSSAAGGSLCSSRSADRRPAPRPSSAFLPTGRSSSATRSRSEDGEDPGHSACPAC